MLVQHFGANLKKHFWLNFAPNLLLFCILRTQTLVEIYNTRGEIAQR